MNDHSEQSSTSSSSSGRNPLAFGGLVIAMCFAAPFLILAAIVSGISLFAGNKTSDK